MDDGRVNSPQAQLKYGEHFVRDILLSLTKLSQQTGAEKLPGICKDNFTWVRTISC